jgi:hypothetical protein
LLNMIWSVRFQVQKAASMKMTAFWDIAPCSVVVYRRFRREYCLRYPRRHVIFSVWSFHDNREQFLSGYLPCKVWSYKLTHMSPILMMDAVRTSETSVYSETTRRYIPEMKNTMGESQHWKVVICLLKHSDTEAYAGSGCVTPRIRDIGTRWRTVTFTTGRFVPVTLCIEVQMGPRHSMNAVT